jgi:hypothetical protein
MPIPDAHLLFAVRRADARIHVEHYTSGRTTSVNAVDPLAREIGERRTVLFRCQPTRLEPPHLACRRRASQGGLAADDPTHRRIIAQPLSVVDILVAGEPPEHRLPQRTDQSVPAVLAGARVREPLASRLRKAERIVKFAIGKQPSIGGDDRTSKLKGQSAVEIEPELLVVRFTRRVRHDVSFRISLTS